MADISVSVALLSGVSATLTVEPTDHVGKLRRLAEEVRRTATEIKH